MYYCAVKKVFLKFFAKFFEVFARFSKFTRVFRGFRTCSDPFRSIWTHSDPFGPTWDSFGCIRKQLEALGRFRIFLRFLRFFAGIFILLRSSSSTVHFKHFKVSKSKKKSKFSKMYLWCPMFRCSDVQIIRYEKIRCSTDVSAFPCIVCSILMRNTGFTGPLRLYIFF